MFCAFVSFNYKRVKGTHELNENKEAQHKEPSIDIIVVPFVPLPLFNEKVTKRVRHAFHLTKDKGKAKNNNGMCCVRSLLLGYL